MARPNDGSGTVWVHDPPVRGAGDDPADDDVVVSPPPFDAPASPSAAPPGPPPAALLPPAAPRSGTSAGCLAALFLLGGVAIGLVVLAVLALVAGLFWLRTSA